MTYDRASHEETEADERLRSRTVIPKSANEPFGLRRAGVIRNRIFAAVAGVAIVAGLGAYAMLVVKPFKSDSPINAVSDKGGDEEIEKSTPDTVEEANKIIAAYYGYLANSDSDGLRNIGNDAAANAVQNLSLIHISTEWTLNGWYPSSSGSMSSSAHASSAASMENIASCSAGDFDTTMEASPGMPSSIALAALDEKVMNERMTSDTVEIASAASPSFGCASSPTFPESAMQRMMVRMKMCIRDSRSPCLHRTS